MTANNKIRKGWQVYVTPLCTPYELSEILNVSISEGWILKDGIIAVGDKVCHMLWKAPENDCKNSYIKDSSKGKWEKPYYED